MKPTFGKNERKQLGKGKMEVKENKRERKDFVFPLWCLVSWKERK